MQLELVGRVSIQNVTIRLSQIASASYTLCGKHGGSMAVGICKMSGGWAGQQDSVRVRYDDGMIDEIPADRYIAQGYQPPIDSLPECPAPEGAEA